MNKRGEGPVHMSLWRAPRLSPRTVPSPSPRPAATTTSPATHGLLPNAITAAHSIRIRLPRGRFSRWRGRGDCSGQPQGWGLPSGSRGAPRRQGPPGDRGGVRAAARPAGSGQGGGRSPVAEGGACGPEELRGDDREVQHRGQEGAGWAGSGARAEAGGGLAIAGARPIRFGRVYHVHVGGRPARGRHLGWRARGPGRREVVGPDQAGPEPFKFAIVRSWMAGIPSLDSRPSSRPGHCIWALRARAGGNRSLPVR